MKPAPVPADESVRIETLYKFKVLDTGPNESLDQITHYIARQFQAEAALLSLIDTNRQWVKSAYGADGGPREFDRPATFCSHTILSGDVLYIPDAVQDLRFADNPLVTGKDGVRFYCGAPLLADNGQPIGSLCVVDSKPRHEFSQQDQALLKDMAKFAMHHIGNYKRSERPAMMSLGIDGLNSKASVFQSDLSSIKSFIEGGIMPMALISKDGQYITKSDSWDGIIARAYGAHEVENFAAHRAASTDWDACFKAAIFEKKSANKKSDALDMPDGTTEYIDWSMRPWAMPDGEIAGAMISMSSVTASVDARKEIEAQNELVNAVLGSIKEGIVACDANGRLNLFNGSTRRMHGLELVDIPLEECGEFYDLYEADGVTPMATPNIPLLRALNGEYVSDAEMVIAPKMLKKVDVVTQAQPLYRNDGTLIGAVASMTDVTQSKIAMKRLQDSEAMAKHVAFNDNLTGLANRAAFSQYCLNVDQNNLKAAQAVYFVDLNGFKLINDTFGNDVGDTVLVQTSNRLKELASDDAFIARVGGDEFIIVQPAENAQAAESQGEKIIEVLHRPIKTDNQSLIVKCSVGIACSPYHGDSVSDLVRRADFAMVHAKATRATASVLFEPNFELETIKHRLLEKELLGSIERDELEVYFQPIMCGHSTQIRGVEALVRWNHPERGLVPPGEFIEVAEESGFMIPMGEWVLERALAHMSNLGDLFLSVNLSPVQFMDPNLVDNMLAIVDRSGFDPRRLEFEVTENLLVNDTETARFVIDAFKEKGIRIALDDFGTGYSSLSYINHFPFDKIKIDRTFINDLGLSSQSESIVQCVINLAKSLGMDVTAEGVETDEHEAILKLMGCQTLQGFKYSKPLPIDSLMPFLADLGAPMRASA